MSSVDIARPTSELIEFGRAAAEAGLLASTCGNASLRLGEDRLLITSSGSELPRLRPEEVTVVSLADGAVLVGGKPSMEVDLHRRAYLARPLARAVLHCQAPAATLLCCMREPPEALDLIPEVSAYVRAHARVPFALPGSAELAASVGRALEDPEVTVVQMDNHGQVVIGGSAGAVLRRATFFELACSMAARGVPLRAIPEDAVRKLRGYSRDV